MSAVMEVLGGGRGMQYEKMLLVKFKFKMLCNSFPLSFRLAYTRHLQMAQDIK
jgi:hypothetical protein